MTTPTPGYAPGSPTSEPLLDFSISPEKILHVAAICRSDGSIPFFPTDAGPVPFKLGPFYYWPVQYPDGARVIVKVPGLTCSPFEEFKNDNIRREMEFEKQLIRKEMECEEGNLRFLARRGFPWSPRLIYSTMESNGLLGRPYIIYTMPSGNRLKWDDTFPAEKANREKVLAQIARIVFDLAALDKWENPTISLAQWLNREIDLQIMNSLQGLNKVFGLTSHSHMILRVLLHRTLHDKTARMPIVFAKNFIFTRNIFIDNDFNVTGLVEWGNVWRMPIRFAFRLPPFLTLLCRADHPLSSACAMAHASTRTYLENVPPIMKADRRYYISRMQYEHATRATPLSVGHLSPLGWEMMCCDLQDLDWNHMIVEALTNREVHRFMACRNFFVAGLQEWAQRDPRAVWTMPRTQRMAGWFFREHRHKMRQLHNRRATGVLLEQAITRGLPWEFVEMMLLEAFGQTGH